MRHGVGNWWGPNLARVLQNLKVYVYRLQPSQILPAFLVKFTMLCSIILCDLVANLEV